MNIRTKRITREQYAMLRRRLVRRDQLICDIMLQTGYRISDVLSLQKSQLKSCRMDVVEQKTGKRRVTHIASRTLEQLRKYATHERGPLLFDVAPSTVYRHITQAAKSLGYKNISAHSFRKLYAWEYCQRYGLAATQKEMLHENIETTILYVYDINEITMEIEKEVEE